MENTKIEKYGLVDFIQEHKRAFTLISIILLVLMAYQEGVPVPTSEPYVKFEIVTERDTYYVGESVLAQYLIRNMMPFPIRIEITDTIYMKHRHTDDDGWSYGTYGACREKPYTVKIDSGYAYLEDKSHGSSTTRPGNLTFLFEYGSRNLNHTVIIIE